jgi:hypothetical protein
MFDPSIPPNEPQIVADPAEVAALKALVPVILSTLMKVIETQTGRSVRELIEEISTECQVQLLTATANAPGEEVGEIKRRAANCVKELLDPLKEEFR